MSSHRSQPKRRRSTESSDLLPTSDNTTTSPVDTEEIRKWKRFSLHRSPPARPTRKRRVARRAPFRRRKQHDSHPVSCSSFQFPVLDASGKWNYHWYHDPADKEASSSADEKYFTPPPSPTFADREPMHFWDSNLLLRYNKASCRDKDQHPATAERGPSDAEKMLAILEERFYPEESPVLQEQKEKEKDEEVFYDALEEVEMEKDNVEVDMDKEESKTWETRSDSEDRSSVFLEKQNSCSSSLWNEDGMSVDGGTSEPQLRRSKRKHKKDHSVCLGCASCTVSNGVRKNRSTRKSRKRELAKRKKSDG